MTGSIYPQDRMPPALCNFDALRTSVEKVMHHNCNIARNNASEYIQSLRVLVEPSDKIEDGFRIAQEDIYALIDLIEKDGLYSVGEPVSVKNARAKALQALANLRPLLLASKPSTRATNLGMMW